MRLLFATTPEHQGALTPFAHACRRAGHQVLVAGAEPLTDALRFWPVADIDTAIRDWAPDLVVGERVAEADGAEALEVPRTAVLRNAAVAVGHGGVGEILSALAAGIPLVLVPRSARERFNARRISELRLGVVPDGDLDDAIRRVLSFEIYTDRARRVRDEINALPSVDEAVDVLMHLAATRATAA